MTQNTANFGPLTAETGSGVWGTPANSRIFASWFRHCTDVAQRMSTKLCTIFGRLLRWYTVYTFSGALPLDGILPVKIQFASKSSVLLYCQRYCTAIE